MISKLKVGSEALQNLETLKQVQTFQHAENTYGALTI